MPGNVIMNLSWTDQHSAVGTLLDRRWGLTVDIPHVSIGSGVFSQLSNANGSNGHPVTYSSTKRSYQPSISTSFQNQQDIRKSHNTTLDLPLLISYIVRTFKIEWLSLQGVDALSKLHVFVEMSLFVLIKKNWW